jgi:hypothetical protein
MVNRIKRAALQPVAGQLRQRMHAGAPRRRDAVRRANAAMALRRRRAHASCMPAPVHSCGAPAPNQRIRLSAAIRWACVWAGPEVYSGRSVS